MTNEQAKQEAIKKAWNELGIDNLEKLLSNGFIDFSNSHFLLEKIPRDFLEVHGSICRPIKLKNFKDNNGWIRIEPDGSNLPEEGVYDVFSIWGKIVNKIHRNNNDDYWWLEHCTHYKPIKEELKPIY